MGEGYDGGREGLFVLAQVSPQGGLGKAFHLGPFGECADLLHKAGYAGWGIWTADTLERQICRPCPRCGESGTRLEGWTCEGCYGKTHYGGVYKPKGDPKVDLLSPIVGDDGELYANCLRCRKGGFAYFEARVIVLGWFVKQTAKVEMRGLDANGKAIRWHEWVEQRVPRTVKGLGCLECWHLYADEVLKGGGFLRI